MKSRSSALMVSLSLSVLSYAGFNSEALAASFTLSQGKDELLVEGRILNGDYEKFLDAISHEGVKTINLKSGGGSLIDALQIGSTIFEQKMGTSIGEGEVCASACAYIWLAGTIRSAGPNAKIGFHSPYENGEEMKISSTGNALAGAYLARLGFDDMTIVFATEAAPREMRWMTQQDATFLGLNVKWSDEKTDYDSPAVLSRDEIRRALLSTNMGRRLEAGSKRVFEALVDETHATQRKGQYWRDAAKNRFFGWVELNYVEWPLFEDEIWRTASPETIVDLTRLNISAAKNLLKNDNAEACLYLMGRTDLSKNPYQTLAEISLSEGDQYIEKKGRLTVRALEEPKVTVKPLTAKKKRAVLQRLEKIMTPYLKRFSSKELRILRTAASGGPVKKTDQSLVCRYYLGLFDILIKDPSDLEMFARYGDEFQ